MKKSQARSDYYPDKWLVVKLTSTQGTHYRVFASWIGGYTRGDSWKLNSGIEKVVIEDNHYLFHGSSGSVYHCDKFNYGITFYGNSILAGLIKQAKEEQDIDIEIIAEADLSKINWSEVC